ncbi:uncharacterized protein LOC116204013 [Punica granatum]|uniref:Uncharacterized protein LOC116204013 n=1 Tax=Punica granatum TaxID=22663 RepID=A0A6P8D487_PUNGR|nr:uncharacterized protein LOC116204013 [Punica granatum]
MEEDTTLYLQLHKLSATVSDETLGSVLSTLWMTRRTGVGSLEKSRIRFLLDPPSISELDPVLACLRSLIRKCVHEDYGEEDLLKLFPPDLPLELQSNLVLVLFRYKNQWKEELSKGQNTLPQPGVPYQVQASLPATFTSFPQSEASTSRRPYHDDPSFCFHHGNVGSSNPVILDSDNSHSGVFTLQQDDVISEHPASMPRLKSMSWTMENSKSSASKVAVVTLKLEDHAKSPSEEIEAKFQLTKDTFEAMLSSMTYICEQLSSKVGPSSEPLQKKQKQ